MYCNMRPQILIISLIILPSQILLAQTKDEIIKYKIFRVDQTSVIRNSKTVYSKYFDSKGKLIKEVEIFYYPFSKSETTYKYLDTLCIQTIDRFFEGKKQVDKTVLNFDYRFDDNKRVIQKTMTNNKGNISIEKISYNPKNQIDTIFIYNNDTAIALSEGFLNYEIKTKENATLKKIKLYSYFDTNKTFIKECNYPVGDSDKSCKIINELLS